MTIPRGVPTETHIGLSREATILVIDALYAAANHGLVEEADVLFNALPALDITAENRALLTSLFEFACGHYANSLQNLAGLANPEAQTLRQLVAQVNTPAHLLT